MIAWLINGGALVGSAIFFWRSRPAPSQNRGVDNFLEVGGGGGAEPAHFAHEKIFKALPVRCMTHCVHRTDFYC